jgi:heme O synthase-like polyprenyltransferase
VTHHPKIPILPEPVGFVLTKGEAETVKFILTTEAFAWCPPAFIVLAIGTTRDQDYTAFHHLLNQWTHRRLS